MMLECKESEQKTQVSSKVVESLLKQRTITLFGEINQEAAEKVTQNLLCMDHESPDPIRLIINSQGGHVESGDTIFDMIRFVKSKVYVIGTGWVASAGALIYVAAPKKYRFSLPNTRFMLHQPMGGVGGSASDAEIEAREIIKMRERLNQTFADQTGQPIEKVREDSDRNFWMDPKEAVAYGVAGKVIKSIGDLP
ncbi:MAG: ATP-dependent Clp protease proteolytic subunit [Verrucomicrobiota bacterium]|nr:ATP-dependent Clp protease proteolytic subunit [Verrucomicrobiota bacterium]